ncbi:hypothetical protein LR48_Vigan02g126700 [Vigna angularis]|uniref:Uncharacterized protein n=1 Tax=Phaseolus angularis TaxID=3914 RepID=A0A0L9TXJ8_PHAAN|nr:hypothetical protein LR48_Vigan02g126700 [Vigna angularis]
MSISELVSLLPVVYQVEDFDKIEEELKNREDKVKVETLALASRPSLSPPSPRSRSRLPPVALALASRPSPLALASLRSRVPPLALALASLPSLSLSPPKSPVSASPLDGRATGGGASMVAAVLGGDERSVFYAGVSMEFFGEKGECDWGLMLMVVVQIRV